MLTCSYDSAHITPKGPLLSCPLPLPCLFLFLGSLVLDCQWCGGRDLASWLSMLSIYSSTWHPVDSGWDEGWRMHSWLAFWACDNIPIFMGQRRAWVLRETQSLCHTSAQCTSLSALGIFPFKFTLQLQIFILPIWMRRGGGQMGWHCQELPLALIELYPEARQATWYRHIFSLIFQVYGYVFSSFCVRSFRRADTFFCLQ